MRIAAYKPSVRFLIFTVLLAILIIGGGAFNVDSQKINSFLKEVPFTYSCIVFILLYVVGTFFIWYLKDPLKIVGAVVFGAYTSTALIYVSEIINACIFFNLSNILGKEFVETKLTGRFKSFYEKFKDMNLGLVFILRAAPLVPYRILDLSFGLSKFDFRKYMLVVILASAPRIFVIQFILAAIKGFSMERMTIYLQSNSVVLMWIFLYSLLALAAAFILMKKMKKSS